MYVCQSVNLLSSLLILDRKGGYFQFWIIYLSEIFWWHIHKFGTFLIIFCLHFVYLGASFWDLLVLFKSNFHCIVFFLNCVLYLFENNLMSTQGFDDIYLWVNMMCLLYVCNCCPRAQLSQTHTTRKISGTQGYKDLKGIFRNIMISNICIKPIPSLYWQQKMYATMVTKTWNEPNFDKTLKKSVNDMINLSN